MPASHSLKVTILDVFILGPCAELKIYVSFGEPKSILIFSPLTFPPLSFFFFLLVC